MPEDDESVLLFLLQRPEGAVERAELPSVFPDLGQERLRLALVALSSQRLIRSCRVTSSWRITAKGSQVAERLLSAYDPTIDSYRLQTIGRVVRSCLRVAGFTNWKTLAAAIVARAQVEAQGSQATDKLETLTAKMVTTLIAEVRQWFGTSTPQL